MPRRILTATRWTRDFELFLERPPLVAGEPADLLVFLTRLMDFSPVRGGELALSVIPEDADQGVQDGAVRVEPHDHAADHDYPAERENAIGDDHEHWDDHEHGPAADRDHRSAPGKRLDHNHGGEVSQGDSVQLMKEQQWLSEFATAVVERRVLRSSVSVTGVLRESADGDAHVTAREPLCMHDSIWSKVRRQRANTAKSPSRPTTAGF
jgi:hypothetical protein